MDEPLTVKFAAALVLEGLRFFGFGVSREEWIDFELMYCARDM